MNLHLSKEPLGLGFRASDIDDEASGKGRARVNLLIKQALAGVWVGMSSPMVSCPAEPRGRLCTNREFELAESQVAQSFTVGDIGEIQTH